MNKIGQVVDGRAIAHRLKESLIEQIRTLPRRPVLGVLCVGDDPVIASFVRLKKKFAEDIGVEFRVTTLPGDTSENDVIAAVKILSASPAIDGVVVQLPLPKEVSTQRVLVEIVQEKDVDVISPQAMAAFASGKNPVIPPVAGAIKIILDDAAYSVEGKEVLVLGHGRLVGAPAALFFRHQNVSVTVVDRPVSGLADLVRSADVIVSGVGRPGLITKEMLSSRSVLIDAGTSEDGGRVVGDADSECRHVALLSTPVPGGVGPVTVAVLFSNLVRLATMRMMGENG